MYRQELWEKARRRSYTINEMDWEEKVKELPYWLEQEIDKWRKQGNEASAGAFSVIDQASSGDEGSLSEEDKSIIGSDMEETSTDST